MMRIFTIGLGAAVAAFGGDILLPAPALERDAPVQAIYRTNQLATGKGELEIRWTDVHGRVVEQRTAEVELTDENEIPFPLDLRRARGMKNEVRVRFRFEGVNRRGQPDRRDEEARKEFLARPGNRDWWDYNIIMWQQYPARDFATLKTLGINAGQYVGRNAPPAAFLLDNDLRWYA